MRHSKPSRGPEPGDCQRLDLTGPQRPGPAAEVCSDWFGAIKTITGIRGALIDCPCSGGSVRRVKETPASFSLDLLLCVYVYNIFPVCILLLVL